MDLLVLLLVINAAVIHSLFGILAFLNVYCLVVLPKLFYRILVLHALLVSLLTIYAPVLTGLNGTLLLLAENALNHAIPLIN